MTVTRPPTAAPTPSGGARPPVERAQAVWQAAVELAAEPAQGGPGGALELLRTAGFDPSTLRHALALARTRLHLRPADARLRSGQELLQAATDWLGAPTADGEVGRDASGHGADAAPAGPAAPAGSPGPAAGLAVAGSSESARPPGPAAGPAEWPEDDLARQRRKREERLLARGLPNDPGVTVADVVADVVAAAATAGDGAAGAGLDVPVYLARQGHARSTIETVVAYLDRQRAGRTAPPVPPRR